MPQASQARQVSQVPQGLPVQRAQQVPPEQAAVLQAPQVLPAQRVQPEQRAQQVLVLLALPALLVLQG